MLAQDFVSGYIFISLHCNFKELNLKKKLKTLQHVQFETRNVYQPLKQRVKTFSFNCKHYSIETLQLC